MPQRLSETALVTEYRRFLDAFDTVMLASVSAQGMPEASLAPFVWGVRPQLYVYLSELAQHARNLKDNGRVSLLFVDNDARAASPFARRRLSFQCTSTVVKRGTSEWGRALEDFGENFGKVMQLIEPLSDFNLYRIQPLTGNYVRGFADAYRIDGALLDQLRLRGGRDQDGDNVVRR